MPESRMPVIDRRTTIKWVLAAAAAVPALQRLTWAAGRPSEEAGAAGYGTDPDLQRTYSPADLWPLTLSETQKRTAAALCDTIIPADAHSPCASSVGVVNFIDEWISAPYPRQQEDRDVIAAGLEWLDAESGLRFGNAFAELDMAQQAAICDDICYLPEAKQAFAEPAEFFAVYRNLTAGGFYTTPAGMTDLKYVGNRPMATFEGPPLEVLRAAGLA